MSKIINSLFKYGINQSKTITKDIVKVKHMPIDILNGGQQGSRLAKIKNKTYINKAGIITTSILRKGVAPHLPGIMAGSTFLSPIPGTSIGTYYIGKLLKNLIC